MRFILLFAWRYLFSKKSNNVINLISWIALIAIAFTTAAFVIIISIMNGFTSVVGDLYNAAEPDIKISSKTGKYISNDSLLIKNLRQRCVDIKYISTSISNQALLKYGDKQMLVTVKGVDSYYNKVTKIDSLIQDGHYVLKESNHYFGFAGAGIASQLQINITNQIEPPIIYSPKRVRNTNTPSDMVNEKPIYLAGTFTLNDDFDYKYLFCDLNFAQDLFDCENKISSIEIALIQKANLEENQKLIQSILGNNFDVKNRFQLNEVLFKTLETEKLWTFLILSFILLIATFSIISALTMLIIEKHTDIQTLYALGCDKQKIEGVFMTEGFLITFGGACVGLLMGVLLCWLQIQFHFIRFEKNYVIPYYPVQVQFSDMVKILVVLLVIGFLAAIYPVRIFTKEKFAK